MHDEPETSWRTELALFVFCVWLSALWAAGCWVGYHFGGALNEALRWLAHLV